MVPPLSLQISNLVTFVQESGLVPANHQLTTQPIAPQITGLSELTRAAEASLQRLIQPSSENTAQLGQSAALLSNSPDTRLSINRQTSITDIFSSMELLGNWTAPDGKIYKTLPLNESRTKSLQKLYESILVIEYVVDQLLKTVEQKKNSTEQTDEIKQVFHLEHFNQVLIDFFHRKAEFLNSKRFAPENLREWSSALKKIKLINDQLKTSLLEKGGFLNLEKFEQAIYRNTSAVIQFQRAFFNFIEATLNQTGLTAEEFSEKIKNALSSSPEKKSKIQVLPRSITLIRQANGLETPNLTANDRWLEEAAISVRSDCVEWLKFFQNRAELKLESEQSWMAPLFDPITEPFETLYPKEEVQEALIEVAQITQKKFSALTEKERKKLLESIQKIDGWILSFLSFQQLKGERLHNYFSSLTQSQTGFKSLLKYAKKFLGENETRVFIEVIHRIKKIFNHALHEGGKVFGFALLDAPQLIEVMESFYQQNASDIVRGLLNEIPELKAKKRSFKLTSEENEGLVEVTLHGVHSSFDLVHDKRVLKVLTELGYSIFQYANGYLISPRYLEHGDFPIFLVLKEN